MTVYAGKETFSYPVSHPKFSEIVEAVNDKNVTKLASLSSSSVYFNLGLQIVAGKVIFNDWEINGVLAKRLLSVFEYKLDGAPWVKFVENLYRNPEQFSRDELYLWLEKSDMPLTEDGCFIAYKVVTSDYMDRHTKTFNNNVGQIVSVARESVDANRNRLCSTGLHFCSKNYLPSFYQAGDRVVLVKVNPADVVSIPSDYDNSKGRCWSYEVVDEIEYDDVAGKDWVAVVDYSVVEELENEELNNIVDFVAPLIANILPISTGTNSGKVALRTTKVATVAGIKTPPIKKQLIKDWKVNNKNTKQLADSYGIPRSTCYGWLKRASII